MKKINNFRKAIIYICAIVMMCLCATAFIACDSSVLISDKIFIDDFSETYTISIKANVKHHSMLPEPYRAFEYNKGLDKLYESMIDTPPQHAFVRKENDIIFVDFTTATRIYSCIIYPGEKEKQYIVHSLTYTLGEWADNQSIFFPAYSLDREISAQDDANTQYTCSFSIEELQQYYTERGYLAEIQDNKLRVVCLLSYPRDLSNPSYICKKAVSWSIVYDEDNLIRFADASTEYPVHIVAP